MGDCVRETLCSSCVHCQVCAHKEAYLSMVKALEETFHRFPKDATEHMILVDPECKFVFKKELNGIFPNGKKNTLGNEFREHPSRFM